MKLFILLSCDPDVDPDRQLKCRYKEGQFPKKVDAFNGDFEGVFSSFENAEQYVTERLAGEPLEWRINTPNPKMMNLNDNIRSGAGSPLQTYRSCVNSGLYYEIVECPLDSGQWAQIVTNTFAKVS